MRLGKSHRFALQSSLLITICSAGLLLILQPYQNRLGGWFGVLLGTGCLAIAFVILKVQIEEFMRQCVKKIYRELTLSENVAPTSELLAPDMKTLTQKIEKFVANKRTEIDTLKVREAYRKEFLGNIAHELKTPLFIVQGYILTLLEGAADDQKLQKKYLQSADKGIERLVHIVKDLDLITKLESEAVQLEREDFDIIALVRNLFELLNIKAAQKHITLTFDKTYPQPVYVNADREKIQQVVSNLLVNSIKYGTSEGLTKVSVESGNGNKIIIRVADNGEGIPAQHLPRIFERFYRVDPSGSRKEGGSGLGLAIVKHIVEAHGEKVHVKSEEAVGSEFSFALENVDYKP